MATSADFVIGHIDDGWPLLSKIARAAESDQKSVLLALVHVLLARLTGDDETAVAVADKTGINVVRWTYNGSLSIRDRVCDPNPWIGGSAPGSARGFSGWLVGPVGGTFSLETVPAHVTTWIDAAPAVGCRVRLRADVHVQRTADVLASRLGALLLATAEAPARPLGQLPIVPPTERARIEELAGNGRMDHGGLLLTDLIREQCLRTPDHVAVTDERTAVTYRELWAQAEEEAATLRARGVGPGTVVAVVADRSNALVAALLGIMLAGGAYLPIDPDWPKTRVRHISAEAEPVLVLGDDHYADFISACFSAPIAPLDGGRTPAVPISAPLRPADDQDIAYIIYTSGTTGWPKGVAVPLRGLVNRLIWTQGRFRLDSSDAVLQKTPYTFDVSVSEFFWPLISGARLVIAEPGGHRDPGYLVDVVRRTEVTTLHFVPSMLGLFVEEPGVGELESLRQVIVGGEVLSPALVNRFRQVHDGELHNMYGPTEASIDIAHWPCREFEPGPTVPIGSPMQGVRALLLDREGQLTPLGSPGELHLGGVCLARGYVGRKELTEQQFIPDPFSTAPGDRLYRTGDLVRWNSADQLEFLGRVDDQVKLRGYRIELGEIEAVAMEEPKIAAAIAMVRTDVGPTPQIVVYLVPSAGAQQDKALNEVRSRLRARLPDYMVPSYVLVLPEVPLTPNGKLDRGALPTPPRERPVG